MVKIPNLWPCILGIKMFQKCLEMIPNWFKKVLKWSKGCEKVFKGFQKVVRWSKGVPKVFQKGLKMI